MVMQIAGCMLARAIAVTIASNSFAAAPADEEVRRNSRFVEVNHGEVCDACLQKEGRCQWKPIDQAPRRPVLVLSPSPAWKIGKLPRSDNVCRLVLHTILQGSL